MTDWLRVIGLSLLSLLIALGLLATGWIVWSRRKLNQFRFTDDQQKAMQDSQRGRRPMWTVDASDIKSYDYELQKKNDQSRVDRK